jgi:two-component system CheB/CheR fusion protein
METSLEMENSQPIETPTGNNDMHPEISTAGSAPLLYVGIGASAGGLEAIENFFSHMPPDNGMTFIVIQHLSPDYKSLMVEILSKRTRMAVYRAEEGMCVNVGSVYLIPPKKNLTIFHGKLLLSDTDHHKGLNLPIDIFFQSLAEDQAEKAIGIVLSGTGSDGMRGIRYIKEAGGMVIVQSEDSAKFDGMPRSAISTGLTDFILPPEEMPDQLLTLAKHPLIVRADSSPTLLPNDSHLDRIFSLLREESKLDFTFYKPSTIMRRIERRMTLNRVDTLKDYASFLKNHSQEVTRLFRDLLIGVTSFFRDTEAFAELGNKWLPDLIRNAGNREVRLWVSGCSSGEEAYSLSILCRECLDQMEKTIPIKVFATDVDREAILRASAGTYPISAGNDLPAGYLSKYFHIRQHDIQIARSIREMVVFAQHNLIKDPPFTNIDLISCRNMLIYLQPVLQRKVMEFFNFSLNPDGLLFLGKSESTGDMADYFEAVHHKHKIYRAQGKRLPVVQIAEAILPAPRSALPQHHRTGGARQIRYHEEERILERFLQAMAGDYVMAAVIVNNQLELLHTLGETRLFFHLPSGRMHNDIVKMAVSEISIPLATGLQRAIDKKESITYSHIQMETDDHRIQVQMRIKPLPVKKGQDALMVVFFDKERAIELAESDEETVTYDLGKEARQRILDLEHEVQFTRENLQATIEELETSNEELQSTNEELLSSNEELHSTNEELQSVNEELHTVNAEHQQKIMELTELSNDINNLMESTQIATIYLDECFYIRKFTPALKSIFKIMDSDIGRPLMDLGHHLVKASLSEWMEKVIQSARPMETQVSSIDGHSYLLRIVPYSIGPKTFSGVLLIFVDITDLKNAQQSLIASQDKLNEVTHLASVGHWEYEISADMFRFSLLAQEIFGLNHDPLLSLNALLHMISADRQEDVARRFSSVRKLNTTFDEVFRIRASDSGQRWIRMIGRPDQTGHNPETVTGAIQDVTRMIEIETALADSEKRYRELFNHIGSGVLVLAADPGGKGYAIVDFNHSAQNISQLPDNGVKGGNLLDHLPDVAENGLIEMIRHVQETGNTVRFPVLPYSREDRTQWIEHSLYRLASGEVVMVYDDITDRIGREKKECEAHVC